MTFNPTALLSIRHGINSSLGQVERDLTLYFAAPDDNREAVGRALTEMHRNGGVFQMVAMDGMSVYCAEIEKVLQELATNSLAPSSANFGIIQRALLALTHYLDALIDGASNATVRLFHPYQELQQARGMEMSFEADLFFPDLNIELPPSVLRVPVTSDLPVYVKKERGQFQLAMLQWLRRNNLSQDATNDALQNMRKAVLNVMACLPQDGRRAFWWIAAGVLDCLLVDGIPPELNATRVLSRIDRQMKILLDGSKDEERSIMNEMLYLLARSHSVSELVDSIKQVYALDEFLPEKSTLPPDELKQILEQLRLQLLVAQNTWEQCSQYELEDEYKNFIAQSSRLLETATRLDNNTLQYLCQQIHVIAVQALKLGAIQRASQPMAMFLLLLGNGIENYGHLGRDFHDQVRLLQEYLLTVLQGEPIGQGKFAKVIELNLRLENRKIMLPLANELLGNLNHVEQGLNAFFNDLSTRGELPLIGRLLLQVLGITRALSLDQACQLLQALEETNARYVQGNNPTQAEMLAVAVALGAISAHIQGVAQGQTPDHALLDKALRELLAAQKAAPVAPAPAVSKVEAKGWSDDDDLQDVFLEEAAEVLETLRLNLEISQLHPASREPLTVMRRGFHTLKGSSRMVGLADIGEVAWNVERAMNKWLESGRFATPALLKLISDARKVFQPWINQLIQGEAVTVVYGDLLKAAEQIESTAGQPYVPEPEPALNQVEEPKQAQKPELSLEWKSEIEFKPEARTQPEIIFIPEHAAEKQAQEPSLENESTIPAEELIEADLNSLLTTFASPFSVPNIDAIPESDMKIGSKEKSVQDTRQLPDEILELSLEMQPQSQPASGAEFESEPALLSSGANIEEIAIGGIRMSPTLFKISTEEAAQHVATLKKYWAALRTSQLPTIEYGFMRAAHTLAGVARTIGAPQIAELAHSLELWLQARMESGFSLDSGQKTMLDNAVAALGGMVAEIAAARVPEPQILLVAQLQAEKSKLVEEPDFSGESEFLVDEKTDITAAGKSLDKPIQKVAEEMVAGNAQSSATSKTPLMPDVLSTISVTMTATPSATLPKGRLVKDDIDADLLPIFIEEADDLYQQISIAMREWVAHPNDGQYSQNLLRTLHTLKGSARMVGAMRMGELVHLAEDYVKHTPQENENFWAGLEDIWDRISNVLEKLHKWSSADDTGLAEEDNTLSTAPEVAAQVPPVKPDAALIASKLIESEIPEIFQTARVAPELPITTHLKTSSPVRTLTLVTPASLLRVHSELIDHLVNDAGEISMARSRIEAELRAFQAGLLELTISIERLHKQVRDVEIHAEGQIQARVALSGETAEHFDPLEFDRFTQFQDLTRSMTESVYDVQTVQQALLKNLDETSSALAVQTHVTREMQQQLMAIRMVPFSTVSERFYRIVRQTARELGKKVNLELVGGEIELDRSMLDKMTAPFEHLLRNAIAHGLETVAEREVKGKLPVGEIRLTLYQESNEMIFNFTDDGAGLDIEHLRRRAIEQNLIRADETVSENQIMQFIFTSGISTATEITEIAGRGVGMDVVRSEIAALNGRINVFSVRNEGTRFEIHLPLTLAVTPTLMVRSGHDLYAIHSGLVERVVKIKAEVLVDIYRQGYAELGDKSYPLHNLSHVLGNEAYQSEIQPYNAILFLRSGDRIMAVHVDELLGNHDMVVKNMDAQLSRAPGVVGAAVLGSGKVVLIINPLTLLERLTSTASAEITALGPKIASQIIVMVVDDSLTVRKATARMLVRAGYQVITAKDGLDALEKLADNSPNVMLLDIEMPRMDGFELIKHLRGDSKFKMLPIIIITSRAAEKHRKFAMELGANAYLGKPYQEEELLEHVKLFSEDELHQYQNFHQPDELLQQIAKLAAESAGK
ncbi:MAG: Hpt domain-containing protein [Candidatus Nitrotoga sp.]